MDEEPIDWPGVLEPSLMSPAVVALGHRLADAAKAGDWDTVLGLLRDGDPRLRIKDRPGGAIQWRPGGPKWFTPLHQAAWHGAPESVVQELLRQGAVRSLVDAKGRTARDVAIERHQSDQLIKQLTPPESPLTSERVAMLNRHLASVIDRRVAEFGLNREYPSADIRAMLRYPPVGILHEVPGRAIWFPIPGMHGGFLITLRQGYLESSSWCRVAGGSGQLHVVTHEGAVLVDEEFV